MRFPLAALGLSRLSAPAAPSFAREDEPRRSPEHCVVLLAEDDAAVRVITQTMLERQGYTVLVANDGQEAVELAAAHDGPVHVLLTDVTMPRLGGRELAQRLANLRLNLRVLFMSGYTPDPVMRRAIVRHRIAFLQKPFAGRDLLQALQRVIDGPPSPTF